MALQHVYEGTAEEIAEQLLRSSLSGQLRAIITTGDEVAGANGIETLDKVLAPLLHEADLIVRQNPTTPSDPAERAFGEIVDEKYRGMGSSCDSMRCKPLFAL